MLRAKVKIEDVERTSSSSRELDAERARARRGSGGPRSAGYLEKDGVRSRTGAPRRGAGVGSATGWSARRVAPGLVAADPARAERDWRLGDIRDGLPQVYAATSELFVAQMLNLDLIGGISFTKGCYTGQEIIARTQHLGRIKRRLSRLRLPPGAWSIGQSLHLADGRTGRLTELASVGEGFEALAVLSLDPGAADGETGSAQAIPAEELALPYRTG